MKPKDYRSQCTVADGEAIKPHAGPGKKRKPLNTAHGTAKTKKRSSHHPSRKHKIPCNIGLTSSQSASVDNGNFSSPQSVAATLLVVVGYDKQILLRGN